MSYLDEIERIRAERGISIAEMCRRAGIDSETYHAWKRETRQPSVKSLVALLGVLGYQLSITPISETYWTVVE